jgi:hypothetical protein
MTALKAIFQYDPNTGLPEAAPEPSPVWRTDFKSVRLLGAVLERSPNHDEACEFYEALEKIQPNYAKCRWVACKLRQSEHYNKLASKSDVSMLNQQKYKQKALVAAMEGNQEKSKLKPHEKIPAYPELPHLSDIIKAILKLDEPGKPACANTESTLPDATTAPVELATSLPPKPEHPVEVSLGEPDAMADLASDTLMVAPDPAQSEADNAEPAPIHSDQEISLATEPTNMANNYMLPPVLDSMNTKQPDNNDYSPQTLAKGSPVFNEDADTNQTNTMTIDSAAMADDLTPRRPEVNRDVAPVKRLPTTTLYLLDYRLLVIRASYRLNIENQLTGESVSVWLKTGRISGDWIMPNGLTTEAQLLAGTCLWIHRIADNTDCIISIPEQGISLRLNCG